MEFGLFTTDSALLQVIFFFMTFSTVYAVLVVLYEDMIIRKDCLTVGFIVLAWSSMTQFLGELTATIIHFPKALEYWKSSEEGNRDRADFIEKVVVAILILIGIAALIWAFFGINFLLVDAGAGTYCKKWTW